MNWGENHHVQIQTISKIAQPSWMHDYIRNHFPVCGWGWAAPDVTDTAAMVQFRRKCMRKHHHQYYRKGQVKMSTKVCILAQLHQQYSYNHQVSSLQRRTISHTEFRHRHFRMWLFLLLNKQKSSGTIIICKPN